MTSPSKRKGSRFEADVAAFLRDAGHGQVARTLAGAAVDRGDLAGLDGWTVECKNRRDVAGAFAAGVDEAVAAREVTGTRYAAAVVKRPRRPVGESYVVMTLAQFAELAGEG